MTNIVPSNVSQGALSLLGVIGQICVQLPRGSFGNDYPLMLTAGSQKQTFKNVHEWLQESIERKRLENCLFDQHVRLLRRLPPPLRIHYLVADRKGFTPDDYFRLLSNGSIQLTVRELRYLSFLLECMIARCAVAPPHQHHAPSVNEMRLIRLGIQGIFQ